MSLIIDTLNALKQRINQDGLLIVQREEGYVGKMQIILNPPATDLDLQRLPFSLPEDYEEFLRLHHGGLLFDEPDGGGGLSLLTVDEILEDMLYYEYPEGWFPIAYGYDGCHLLITNQSSLGGYLYWFDSGSSFEDDQFLGMTFEQWLEKFIIAQGSKFWEWNFRSIRHGQSDGISFEEMIKTKPTLEWEERIDEEDNVFTKENIYATNVVLDSYINNLRELKSNTTTIEIMKCVKEVVIKLNEINGKYDYIDTMERQELYEFIKEAARIVGLESEVDITEEWREW